MKLANYIKKSIFTPDGKESTTRISSYIVLILIVMIALIMMVLEMLQMTISNEIIAIFILLLAHQITLLGINKKYESKQEIAKYNINTPSLITSQVKSPGKKLDDGEVEEDNLV